MAEQLGLVTEIIELVKKKPKQNFIGCPAFKFNRFVTDNNNIKIYLTIAQPGGPYPNPSFPWTIQYIPYIQYIQYIQFLFLN